MTNKLTTSQQKGVTITDKDLCVVAGPGSGKTRVLVERFVNLVTTHKASIGEILTLTFTEKAANEMKVRVSDLFRQKGMEQERQEIEFAYLSTIHGFCARILRENAIEAGIDPQFRVMDELESGRLKNQALENTLKERADEKTLDTFLNDIFWKQTDAKRSRLKSFRDNMIQLYEKIRSACVPIAETVKIDDLSPDISSSYNRIEELAEEIKDIYSDSKLTPKTREKVEYVLVRWNASSMQEEIEELYGRRDKLPQRDDLILTLLNRAKDIQGSIKLQVSKDVKKPLAAMRDELKVLIGLLVEDYSTSIKMRLRDFLVNFDIAYSERKKVKGCIDFTDLEVKTIELLENREHIATEIKRKFKYILVDEFQDISGLQKKIIDLIRGKDNLFIVGDAKQSIYGFRNADVEIFQDIQNDIDPGSLISLNENFRSRPQILNLVNHIFNELWPGNSASQDSTQQLKPGAEFSDKSLPSIEIIVAEGKDKTEARKWESMEVAKRIKELVDKGEIKITNRREQERNISYRDFAILFRSTTDIKLYEHSLSHLDIPYYVVSGRGFYNTTEVTDLINLLKVIESPLD
jgi:ATP-dependent helicase/nuclease subunit A